MTLVIICQKMTVVKVCITTEKVTNVIICFTMDKSLFVVWLEDELETREWSPSDLARRSGISQSAISLVMNGKRSPGMEFFDGISKAFKVPLDLVYQKAGALPVKPNADEAVSELTHIYHELNEDNKQDLLDYAKMKRHKQERDTKNNGKRYRVP